MSLIESVPLREWGTRYDSLSTSPSPSIASSLSRIPTTTCTANSSLLTVTPAQIHTQGDKVSHEASVFVGRSHQPSIPALIHALIIPFQSPNQC